MKENNKPILAIYAPHIIMKLNKMLDLWTQMAKKRDLEASRISIKVLLLHLICLGTNLVLSMGSK